jgi:hypothetical protein
MGNCSLKIILGVITATFVLRGASFGQSTSPQSMASSSVVVLDSIGSVHQPANTPDTLRDPASLIPDLPPLPASAKASLIGGTVEKLDRVKDEIAVRTFGGGKMNILFDPRTRVYRDGAAATIADLRKGDRVYVDAILNDNAVFARSIRVKLTDNFGQAEGIVTSYEDSTGELQMRDVLSPQPLTVFLTARTKLIREGHPADRNGLTAGTLVAVKFSAGSRDRDVAQEISMLALPGASYTFAGSIAALDLHLNRLLLTSNADGKTYEVFLPESSNIVGNNLRLGASVTLLVRFEGDRYVAQTVTVNSPRQP